MDNIEMLSLDNGTPAAIQWQISDHSGLSREGASGSVRVTTYVIFDLQQSLCKLEVVSS